MSEGRKKKGKKFVFESKWSPPNQAWCQSKPPFYRGLPRPIQSSLQSCRNASKCSFLQVVGLRFIFPSYFPCTSPTPEHSNQDFQWPLTTLLERAKWKLPRKRERSNLILSHSRFWSISKSCLFLILNTVPSPATTDSPHHFPFGNLLTNLPAAKVPPQTSPFSGLRVIFLKYKSAQVTQ